MFFYVGRLNNVALKLKLSIESSFEVPGLVMTLNCIIPASGIKRESVKENVGR